MYGQTLGSDTVAQAGTAAAPGANVAVATIAAGSLPAGTYRVYARLYLTGTAETQRLNGSLRRGGVEVVKVETPGVASVYGDVMVERVTVDGTQALSLNAVANATAGSVYDALLTAQRVE